MLLQPSVENLACVLCKHLETTSWTDVVHSYAYLKKGGFEGHPSIGQYLVSTFVEVGSMQIAPKLFERLVYKDKCAWSARIKGYIDCREFGQALGLYYKMYELYLQPEKYTFIALIKTCAEVKDLKSGCKLHIQAVLNGWFESDLFVGNSIVDMYAKCGQLAAAQDVFNRLPVRDLVSWNALVAGFAKNKESQKVLNCVRQMCLEGISPDATTFVCSLNVCGGDCIKHIGLEFHAEIVKKGLLETNNFVGNALIDMYSKCNTLLEAQNVFDRLSKRDVVTWNSLISGYADQGCGKEALTCFHQMPLAGVSPNAVTFVCTLKACCNFDATDLTQAIHAEICRKGLLKRNLYVGNALIDMYSQSGLLAQAHEVLDSLPIRNVVSWTALIAGYANSDLGEEALYCFDQMELDGVPPNAATFICSLKACGSIGAVVKGAHIHAEITRTGLIESCAVSNAVVDMYSKCGLIQRAQEVFDKLQDRDLILWTALIAGYSMQECGDKALECFRQLRLEGLSPNAITYVCGLNACAQIAAADEGKRLHAEIVTKGLLHEDAFIGNALVHMYAKCGLLTKAQELFDNLPVHDVVSWTALISAYVEHKFAEEALGLLEKMRCCGLSPNAATYICILKACSAIGATGMGRNMHHELAIKGLLEKNLLISNALVDMYAKCGSLTKAQEVFFQLPDREVVSWTALIAGYMKVGESYSALHVFDTMNREGPIPDLVAFINVLSACSRMGVVARGQEYLDSMSSEYGIKPTLEHHTCMADLLSRAGHLEQALDLVEKIPFRSDLVLVHTVLDACRKWGNEDIGRKVFEHALHFDEKGALSTSKAGINMLEGKKLAHTNMRMRIQGEAEDFSAIKDS